MYLRSWQQKGRNPPPISLFGTLKMLPGKHVLIWRKSGNGPCNSNPCVFGVPKMFKMDLISLFKMFETGNSFQDAPRNHHFTLRNRDQRVQKPYFSGLRRIPNRYFTLRIEIQIVPKPYFSRLRRDLLLEITIWTPKETVPKKSSEIKSWRVKKEGSLQFHSGVIFQKSCTEKIIINPFYIDVIHSEIKI